MLYIIYAESAQYCGYGQHFVVEATNSLEAEGLISDSADEYFWELYQEELEEDSELEGPYFSVQTTEVFDEKHESWKYYQDPTQQDFYIKVNV